MADGNSVRNVIGGTFEDVGESVVKPVTDEVGKAIETGVQSVIQGPKQQASTSQQTKPSTDSTQSKMQEQTNLAEARRKLAYWKQIEEAQGKVREEERQKEVQRQQQLVQAKQEKQQIKQFQIVKKEQALHPAVAAKGKMEIKRGIGG